MSKIKEGDLVKVRDYDTGLIGLVVDMMYHQNATQVGIIWCGSKACKVQWEPAGWLEVVSEGG